MAERNVSTVEEDISYFCTPCSKRYKRTKRLFNAVHSLDSFYTCIRCGQAFHSGFSRKKMSSTEAVNYQCDEHGMVEGNVSIVEEASSGPSGFFWRFVEKYTKFKTYDASGLSRKIHEAYINRDILDESQYGFDQRFVNLVLIRDLLILF
ncbi:hypothetical protein TNCV_4377681 [Trichonephila clavipes]|nr:hypothetical protein TNCV_4377681 [Trichonephila clavipes]